MVRKADQRIINNKTAISIVLKLMSQSLQGIPLGHKYFLDIHNDKHDFIGSSRFVRSVKALLFEHNYSSVIHHYFQLTQERLTTLRVKTI